MLLVLSVLWPGRLAAQEEYYSVARKRDQRYVRLVAATDSLFTGHYHFTGQEFYLPLEPNEPREWQLTLYGNTRYRIALASNRQEPPVSYTLQDRDRRLLFESSSVGDPTSWDFILASSTECTLTVRSKHPPSAEPRRVLVRIGFLPSYKGINP